MTQIRTNEIDFNASMCGGNLSFSIVNRKNGAIISTGLFPIAVADSFIEAINAAIGHDPPPVEAKSERKSTRKTSKKTS